MELISVIIPYFNKQSTINRSVESVFNQTYCNWELFIVDDCSEIPLINVLKYSDPRIIILSNKSNAGPGPTRQRGLELASGKFVAFLDADDWWDKDFLIEMLNPLLNQKQHTAGSWCISKTTFSDRILLRQYSDLDHTDIREAILKYPRPWQTGSILWRREYCGNWGDLSTSQDYYFELSTSKQNNKLVKVPKVLYFVDQTQGNHRIDLINKARILDNTFQLFSFFHNNFKFELSFFYRIVLFNRVIRSLLKIQESELFSPLQKDNYWGCFKSMYFISSYCMQRNLILLKITNKILQNSPFKIYV
jgi:glycosyltransferase involved in cell wall biosynthesis